MPGIGSNGCLIRNDRKSLFRHSREKVRNCRARPPRAGLRGPRATTEAANRPGWVLLSRQSPITGCCANMQLNALIESCRMQLHLSSNSLTCWRLSLRSAVLMTAISLGRVLLDVLGSDLPGTLNKQFGLRIFAQVEIEIRQAAETGSHGQVLRS